MSAPAPEAQFLGELQERLLGLSTAGLFSGTVLIARGDSVLFQQAYGFANNAFRAPNTLDTRFNLGSMGKMFTGVAILQLAQQRRLSLDDTLLKWIPDYPDTEIASQITIEQLLTHTSGLGDIFNAAYRDTPKNTLDTLQSHLRLFAGQPLQFSPGTAWSYSNAGFIVLGLVVERASGQNYYDYVREHIFQPAGMKFTDNYKPHDDIANLAIGYTADPAAQASMPRGLNFPGGLPVTTTRITNSDFLQPGASAGGGYSTVEDLSRFAKALREHVLLNPSFTEQFMTGKVATGRGTDRYALGIEDRRINSIRIVGHSGGGPGISSNLDIYPDLGYTVVVLTNLDAAAPLANERIRLWLTGQPLPRPVRGSPEELERFVGSYRVDMTPPGKAPPGPAPPAPILQIEADTQGLWLISGSRHRLLPLSATEFFDDNAPELRYTFVNDRRGVVTGFSFPGPTGRPVRAQKQLPSPKPLRDTRL